jgi:hypothetical protein
MENRGVKKKVAGGKRKNPLTSKTISPLKKLV